MKWQFVLMPLLVASSASTIAVAQEPNVSSEDGEVICVGPLTIWLGTPDNVKQIRDNPVPESFRARKSGRCIEPFRAQDLVAWHLRFGTEDTAAQALRFIEERDGPSEVLVARLDRDLDGALTSLAKDIRLEQRKEDSRLDAAQPVGLKSFISKLPSVQALETVKRELHRNLLDRINLYLSAAEIFGSERFAAQARKIFTQYDMIERKLLPARDGGRPNLDPFVSQALEYVQDSSSRFLTSMEVELRLAVLEAQLNPDATTIDRARDALRRRHQPAYANARDVAFGGGDDFCDLGDEHFINAWQKEIVEACKNDFAFVNKVMAYGYADAMLAILTDADQRAFGKWDWEEYVILHQKEMVSGQGTRNDVTGDHDRVIGLKLALIDRHISQSKAKVRGDRHWSYERAWGLLAELSPLINPAENPVRFRQIAERAIAVDAELQKEDEGWRHGNAQLLAYYRLNLQNLDKLATAEVP